MLHVYVAPDYYRDLWDLKGSLKCRLLQYFLEMDTSRKCANLKIKVFKCDLTKRNQNSLDSFRRGIPKCETEEHFRNIENTMYYFRWIYWLFIYDQKWNIS